MARHRMYTLGFSTIWTVLATLFVLFFDPDPGPEYQRHEYIGKVILTAMPFVGLLFICDSLRKLHRFRSVRCETIDGEAVYVWTELNGSKKRSNVDPRIQWDKEDRNFADP